MAQPAMIIKGIRKNAAVRAFLALAVVVLVGCCPEPVCRSNADCDDGDPCTIGEACLPGGCFCLPATTTLSCDDADLCTTDSCDPITGCINDPVICPPEQECDPATGLCVCMSDSDCDDLDFCNGTETCDLPTGECTAGADRCPDDGLFCTGTEGCDETNDRCTQTGDPCATGQLCDEPTKSCLDCIQDSDCDDGKYCDGVETCSNHGRCLAGSNPCEPGETCDESRDVCGPAPECEINAKCTEPTPVCDTEAGVCVECLADGDCNDGVVCTDDVCANGSCVFAPSDENCLDNGVFCDGMEFCDLNQDCISTGNPCAVGEQCCEDSDTCGECCDDSDCDDGLYCSGEEQCDAFTQQCMSDVAPCRSAVCGTTSYTADPCNENGDCCTVISLQSPGEGATADLSVTFVFDIECAPEETLACWVATDKGVCPCDHDIEDEFPIPDGETSVTISLDSSRYAGECFEWDVFCRDANGNEVCTDVRRMLCINP